MAITTILFDLDGTLLPMDQEVFTKAYFGKLAAKLAPHGYRPAELIETIWAGTVAMVKNTGEKTNEEVFWDVFAGHFGEAVRKDLPLFDEFYLQDFPSVQTSCGFAPEAAPTVALCRELGYRVALATNPLFPAEATRNRIRWAGLDETDFELYTTYENSRFCKPNPDYYTDILAQLQVRPEQCVMVGNDVDEDMVAARLGMKVFLLTNCLLNKHDKDISVYPNGDFAALQKFLKELGQNE